LVGIKFVNLKIGGGGGGGLRLYSTKSRNLALLAKLNWRVMEDSDALWAKTLKSKYCPSGIMDDRLRTCSSGSSNWKGLKVGHEVFRKGLRWVVNNGRSVSFWLIYGLVIGPLRILFGFVMLMRV
jgi:hypothetical protein